MRVFPGNARGLPPEDGLVRSTLDADVLAPTGALSDNASQIKNFWTTLKKPLPAAQ
jgi:hypothetical protein